METAEWSVSMNRLTKLRPSESFAPALLLPETVDGRWSIAAEANGGISTAGPRLTSALILGKRPTTKCPDDGFGRCCAHCSDDSHKALNRELVHCDTPTPACSSPLPPVASDDKNMER